MGGGAISIHVPRVEDDTVMAWRFMRGRHFNPRPPCGGRQAVGDALQNYVSISIHVPRVEDDRRALVNLGKSRAISIHVPRVEDDRRT